MEELEEIQEFLGHIHPKVGEQAFNEIWSCTERLKKKLNQLKQK